MSKSTIEVTPKTMLGYALFLVGLVLLVYVAFNCLMLANGTVEPLKIGEELINIIENQFFLGIMLQIGMYALLIFVSFILMKIGLSISRT